MSFVTEKTDGKPAGDPARSSTPPTSRRRRNPRRRICAGWARSHQWGTRVKPDKHGLRLGDLNVGIYGEVPPVWTDQTRAPRGAVSRRGVPPLGYAIRDKVDLWADSAADMYEEAIQRRWAPATSIPWSTIEPLPDDVERAICQVCTELSQYANADVESVTHWQSQMAYGYHEVKQFLATVSFDGARHMEVFRKRALCNGGGLGLEGPGEVNRMILESRGGWTEAVLYLFVMRGLFTQTMYRYLRAIRAQRRRAHDLRALPRRQSPAPDVRHRSPALRDHPSGRSEPDRARSCASSASACSCGN